MRHPVETTLTNILLWILRTQTVEGARAEAERVRLIGASEARAIEAVGRAEAEKMRMKASAYKQYGDAAIMALVLEALPQIAAEVAAPLAKTDEIVLLGGADKTTTEVNKLLGKYSHEFDLLNTNSHVCIYLWILI